MALKTIWTRIPQKEDEGFLPREPMGEITLNRLWEKHPEIDDVVAITPQRQSSGNGQALGFWVTYRETSVPCSECGEPTKDNDYLCGKCREGS
jgi:hypothetical protein